ncbi:MAG TPA: hypothetical protein VK465_01885 [Fibrobacteria bacterium]|nr:hypothetical protein [Fibrobacteria bacterium]
MLVWANLHAQTPLLVCLPGGHSPARIDSLLGPPLAPRKVLAFLRVRDLEDVLPSYPKASIVTTSTYAGYLKGYSIQLKGRRREAHSHYLVVSADTTLTSAGLGSRRLGILDFLGREKIPRFVEDAFGLKPAMLKRVNKREDLLSLLGMEAVDAIVVEANDLAELKKETKLKLAVVSESKPIANYPVLAVPANGDEGLNQVLLNQPKPVLEMLGVDRWE